MMEQPSNTPSRAAAPFVVDALNVAYWCGSPPTLRLPLALATGLRRAGYQVQLVFDASTSHQLAEHEWDVYRALLMLADVAVQVPSGTSADRHLLTLAKASGARVISRDRFRQHRRKFRSIVGPPDRRVDGVVSGDCIHLPAIDCRMPLPGDVDAAWRECRKSLGL